MKIENLNTPERNAKREINKKKAFVKFMDNPMTKVILSLQPPNEHLEALLQAAFVQGFEAGGGHAAIEIAEALMSRRNGA